MNARLVGIIALLVFALLVVLTLLVCGPGAAGADTSPSPSPSVTAEPEPASAALVRRALAARGRAQAARSRLCRVRSCFKSKPPRPLAARPLRTDPAGSWLRALRRWIRQAADWRAKSRAGRRAMLRPGGATCGARWLPLARWAGWPEGTLSHLAYIIDRESGGRPDAANPSVATGLLQILRSHVSDPWRLTEPEYNLRVGLRLYRAGGWAPWSI